MPIGTNVAKSIMSKNLEDAKKFLTEYQAEVKSFLEKCKEEGPTQQVSLMQLTYQDEVKYLEENLKKSKEAAFDCSNVPDDTALNKAFAEGKAEAIKKAYSEYHKSAASYLDHCAVHEEFDFVYEASLLHDEEYENWEKSTK
jgi:hypothetical protein